MLRTGIARLPTVFLAAAGLFVASAQAEEVTLPQTVAWTAYDVGSTGYNQAIGIGSALKNKYGVSLRVLPGKNDVARMAPLRDGKVQFTSAGSDSIYAQEALFVFGQQGWGPIPIRLALLNVSDGASTAIAVARTSDIHTIADLKGKRIPVIKGGPVSRQLTTALLSFADLTWDDVVEVDVAGFAASAEALLNGQADAYVTATHTPNNLKQEASPQGLRFLAMPFDNEEGWTRVVQHVPWMFKHLTTLGPTIPKEGIELATTPYPILLTTAEQSEDLVYNMTKAMFVLYPEYKDAAPGANGWALDRQKLADVFQPVHEGAIRYYKEIGHWKPEHQKRHEENVARQAIVKAAWDAYAAGAPKEEDAFNKGWMAARAEALKAKGLPTIADSW